MTDKAKSIPKGKAETLAADAKKKRKEELELRRQQAQQQQRTILFIGAVVFLIVVVVGIFFASRPPDVTFPADLGSQYADIPTGTTQTGPTPDIKYPIAFPYLGSPNAPVKIEELASFSCPFCLQYHDDHTTQILDEIKAGRAQYIYILTTRTGDFDSTPGSKAAYCTMQQSTDKFWAMHDILYDWQKRYGAGAADSSRLEQAAQKLGLDMGKFDSCMSSSATAQYVVASSDYATARGLVGTPTVFLFANGKQIQPPSQNSGETPGSVASFTLNNLRGIIEANAVSTSSTPAAPAKS